MLFSGPLYRDTGFGTFHGLTIINAAAGQQGPTHDMEARSPFPSFFCYAAALITIAIVSLTGHAQACVNASRSFSTAAGIAWTPTFP